jgi:hypothetical protein
LIMTPLSAGVGVAISANRTTFGGRALSDRLLAI